MTSSSRSTTSSARLPTGSSLGPLTTRFVPSISCSNGKWTGAAYIPGITEVYQFPDDAVDFRSFMGDCYPPGASTLQPVYSPGMCPSGFTTAYSTVISGSITSAQCCPPNYETWRDDFGPLASTLYCFSSYTTSKSIDCSRSTTDSECVQATVGPGVAESIAIYVGYQQKDLSLFPAGYTPGAAQITVTTSTATPTPALTGTSSLLAGSSPSTSGARSTSTTLTAPNTGPHKPNTQGLSAGAKAGIAIGVTISVLTLISIITILLFQRRKRQRKAQPHHMTNSDLPEFVGAATAKPKR
ncbi:hypothetical protein BDV96DRAFT_654917 [Lophiotrema nucula]|uniref:Mid2 domain-containing protein n=1 Tax=Lophiotrema nucula TaxID=690887 RepID=A0A6A5YIP0_9PLEO|nr:hypothetical protein BDV96DRAFT_654917 [Lophiotrema nucula]